MVKSYTCTDVKRLDLFVSEVLNESRNQASELIKKGGVCVNNNTICKPSFKLSLGDEVKIEKLEAQVSEAKEVDFDVEVLFEDEYLLIINKPPFLTVHPSGLLSVAPYRCTDKPSDFNSLRSTTSAAGADNIFPPKLLIRAFDINPFAVAVTSAIFALTTSARFDLLI